MRIGIVCHPTYGGSGIVATELAKGLAERGHQVHVFSYSMPVRMHSTLENVRFHRVEVSAYPLFRYPPYPLEITAGIVDTARTEGLDVVHAHYAIPHGMSALDARMIMEADGVRLPFVTTLHGTDITIVGSEPSLATVTRFILRTSDAVTSVSEWLRRETISFFGTEREIHVIPNSVDPRVFRRHSTGCLRAGFATPEEKIIVHISNFRPVKNIPHILEAFAAVAKELPARLLLIGDGPERQRAEAVRRELGLDNKVCFPGMQSDVVQFLSLADLYMLASSTESFGLSPLEAMACGVPVVGYRVGGVPEVVVDGETGCLVDLNDVAALGQAALKILRNEPQRRKMSIAARKHALEHFSAEKVVSQYEAVYRKILEAK